MSWKNTWKLVPIALLFLVDYYMQDFLNGEDMEL